MSVTSWAPGRLDVFVRGSDAALWHSWCNGPECDADTWPGWESLGGFNVGNPVATSPGQGKLWIFTQGGDNTLRREVYDGGWRLPETVASNVQPEPGARPWWWNPGHYSEGFFAVDNRGYTGDGDWAVGDLKAQCAVGDRLIGISTTLGSTPPALRGHSALCQTDRLKVSSGRLNVTERTHSLRGADDRADSATHDWDRGFIKAECASTEAVTGVAAVGATVGGALAGSIDRILCTALPATKTLPVPLDAATAPPLAANDAQCSTLLASRSGDVRVDTSSGDWDPVAFKTECAANQILKGVSKDSATGEIHAILCCDPVISGF